MGYTTLTHPLDAGLPARIPLGGGRDLVLAVPVGQARRWLADDPGRVVIDIAAAAREPGSATLRALDATVPRLTLVQGERIGETTPVVAGRPIVLGLDGRTLVEIVVDGLIVSVGSLRSPGLYGSVLRLRWRSLEMASAAGPARPVPDDAIPRPPVPQLLRQKALKRRRRWWRRSGR
jgi:hypothetical protein